MLSFFVAQEVANIEKRFLNNRLSFPSLCIVTSCDGKEYSVWTKNAPIPQVIARVVVLAKSALTIIENYIVNSITFNPKVIIKFISPFFL